VVDEAVGLFLQAVLEARRGSALGGVACREPGRAGSTR
jgi:hypothetical protein